MNNQVLAQIAAIYGLNASYKNKVRVIKQFAGTILSANNITKEVTYRFLDNSTLTIINA